MEKLLEKTKKLNWLIQKSGEGTILFDELCEILSEMMKSNVYVISRKGRVLGVYYAEKKDTPVKIDPKTGKEYLAPIINERLMDVTDTLVNLTGNDALQIFQTDRTAYGKYSMVVPVIGGGRRLGTVIFSRYSEKYNIGDVILGEYSATAVGVDIERRQNREIEQEVRKKAVAQLAIGTLSYTEADSIRQLFAEFEGSEGMIITGKASENIGIAKSVIANALKKLESTGVIESRSLGMKGTHIRIINEELKTELQRLEF